MELEISEWVDASAPADRSFREAVHIILVAISEEESLSMNMIMKGGLLIGIKYGSSRYTRDIDFSTSTLYSDFDCNEFSEALDSALKVSSISLGYNLRCLVQSLKVEPNERGTFPTLKVKVGYARKDHDGAMRRLERKNSANTVKIDYSFNEEARSVQDLIISDGETIKAYGLTELISEKYRSVLQQVVRERARRQDIYDLSFLIDNHASGSDEEKYNVLESLFKKSEGKGLEELLNSEALSIDGVYSRSKDNYESLRDDLSEDLPDFDFIYSKVKSYYESMPWEFF